METVLLRPVDTFFFRDHRPLTLGEDAKATGLFPPRPGTVYGALRSAYIHRYSDFRTFSSGMDTTVKRWMGTPIDLGDFSVRSIWLYDGNEPLLPLPLDYQVVSLGDREKAYPLELREEDRDIGSDGATYRLYGTKDEKSAPNHGAYVGERIWKSQLFHRRTVDIYRHSQWLIEEPKVGIARSERTKQASEGMLYQLPMLRFKEQQANRQAGLLVICDRAPSFADIRFIQLGGEARPWHVSQVERHQHILSSDEERVIIDQIKESGIARIILLTPAIWKGVSRPEGFDTVTGQLKISDDLQVKVLTAAIGRPFVIGGWDIVRNRPKERMYAVPAGSVLYVEVEREKAERFVKTVHRVKLTDELAHEGYGYAVCGAYA